MSLYDRARKDNAKILGRAQGFTVPVVFTSPTGSTINARCFYIDVNLDINPSTGMPIVSRRVAISVNKYAPDDTLQFPTENPVDTPGSWKFTFTNNDGATATYIAEKPIYDRTLAQYTMIGMRFNSTEVE